MTKLNPIKVEKILKDKGFSTFSSLELSRVFDVSYNTARKFLLRYCKKKFISKLKNGLYVFTDRKPSDFLIANRLYLPSYISLESALSYYHIIPEAIYSVTSIAPKSTRNFTVFETIFSYQRIKKEAFTGYLPVKFENETVLIAKPEKALVDYLYFVSLKKKKMNERIVLGRISKQKVLYYVKLFGSKRLNKLVKEFYAG